MNKFAMRSLLAALPVIALSACQINEAAIGLHYGETTIDGGMQWTTNPPLSANNGVNPVESFGLDNGDEDAGQFGIMADTRGEFFHYTFRGSYAGWEGEDGVLQFDFEDIPAGETVDSEFAMAALQNYFTWDVVPPEMIEFGLGFGINAVFVHGDVEHQAVAPIETDTINAPVFTPMLAGRFGLHAWRFDLEAYGAWMSLDAGDLDMKNVLELDACLKFRFAGRCQMEPGSTAREVGPSGLLVVGYRASEYDVEYDDDEDFVHLDVEFDGPYAGLMFGW
jgi:hypothetical protein